MASLRAAVRVGFCGFYLHQVAFDVEMRRGKALAEDAVAKKPSGKELFLCHLVAEEEDEVDDEGKKLFS